MTNEERFRFLEEHPYYTEKEESVRKNHRIYLFKTPTELFSIWVPLSEKNNIRTYLFFTKIENKDMLEKVTPKWFQELVEKTENIIDKRDRLRQLIKGTV